MGPADLRALTAGFTPLRTAEVIVGLETADDAGVVRLSDDLAVVTTADFITPPFDDPRAFGAIAAANALSDVYAMGGTPVCALNLCAFPRELAIEAAREILAGAADKAAEAGCPLVGGHTVASPELFFGLAVTGRVAPLAVWRNHGLSPGDELVLSKPLGTGLYVGAARKGLLGEEALAAARASMMLLNAQAARIAAAFSPRAVTDITGFGFVGHALGMARGSRVDLEIDLAAVPLFPEAAALSAAGVTCRGERDNRSATAAEVAIEQAHAADPRVPVLFDPQTSGGLLVGVAVGKGQALAEALCEAGLTGALVGRATAVSGDHPRLRVI